MAGVLGQTVAAPDEYTPSVLERIDRRLGRDGIKNPSENVGSGYDVWHCYELSWTLPDGAVTFTTGALIIPADSPFTVESKSLKLYLNSLNAHVFKNDEEAIACIEKDLSELTQSQVKLVRIDPDEVQAMSCELGDDAVRVVAWARQLRFVALDFDRFVRLRRSQTGRACALRSRLLTTMSHPLLKPSSHCETTRVFMSNVLRICILVLKTR